MKKSKRYSIRHAVAALHDRRGFTLVETIVAFSLLTLLMALTVTVLVMFTNVYIKVNSINHARSVSGILFEDLYNELSTASVSGEKEYQLTIQETETENIQSISYINENGHPTTITVSDGMLHIIYDEIKTTEGQTLREKVTWHYPKEMYMEIHITGLVFEPISDTNKIKVKLTVQSGKTEYSYNCVKVIECYNVEANYFK